MNRQQRLRVCTQLRSCCWFFAERREKPQRNGFAANGSGEKRSEVCWMHQVIKEARLRAAREASRKITTQTMGRYDRLEPTAIERLALNQTSNHIEPTPTERLSRSLFSDLNNQHERPHRARCHEIDSELAECSSAVKNGHGGER